MGSVWLTSTADWLRGEGLTVVEYGGWTTRARSSGGYEPGRPLCVMWHHTASNTDPASDCYYMCHNTSNSARPTANVLIARDGVVWVMAAGATNTNGKGRSLSFSRGTVPKDSMNSYAFGMEIANAGTGQVYPKAQIDAAFIVSNTMNAHLGNVPSDVSTHYHYAPDRKIDPAMGDECVEGWHPRECTNAGTWDNDYLQDECDRRAGIAVPAPIPPTPTPTPPAQEDFMAALPTIKKGDQGPYVERMQHLLAAAGFMNPGNVSNYDGVWGNGTDGAKAEFDNAHGLGGSDTSCGQKSWESLMTGRKW
jgi:hypothetical protein